MTAVKFALKGGRIASGTEKGEFKLWNAEHENLIVSYEADPLSGIIKDIAFTDDGEKAAVVGDGGAV